MKKNVKTVTAILAATLVLGCSKPESFEPEQTMKEVEQEVIYSGRPTALGSIGMAGVNWADGRDNFVDGWIIPSGCNASDTYQQLQQKTADVVSGFQNNMGANTIRLGINPETVLDASWWPRYQGIIDKAVSLNMKVVLGCWESASSKDGKIDDTTDFWDMWDEVISVYKNNSSVYFEVFNEPHGYTVNELKVIYTNWLTAYDSQVPRGRVLLGGNGYSENVTSIGSDSQFDGCLLSLHIYAWWGSYTNPVSWENALQNVMGSYSNRTVLTEFGVPMTTGINYSGAVNSNYEIAFLQGITTALRNNGMSSIYWPGYRDGDSYTIQQNTGSGSAISLSTTNSSGLSRIQFGWGVTPSVFDTDAEFRIMNANSGKALDVNQASTINGGNIIQWTFSNGNNQLWKLIETDFGVYRLVNKNSGLALDVNGASTTNGATIIQWDAHGGFNQQWYITETTSGVYRLENRNSALVLDVNGGSAQNGADVIQWSWNSGGNQQWQIIEN